MAEQPENLLVADDGHLKLCDFGSAKMMQTQDHMINGVDKDDASGALRPRLPDRQ